MTTRRWAVVKDLNVKTVAKEGRGGNPNGLIGKGGGPEVFRYYTKFEEDIGERSPSEPAIHTITEAVVVFHTDDTTWGMSTANTLRAHRINADWGPEDTGDTWRGDAYRNAKVDGTPVWFKDDIPTFQNSEFEVDVISFVQKIVPTKVLVRINGVDVHGLDLPNHGLRWKSFDEKAENQHVGVWTHDSATTFARRPYLRITYIAKNSPPTAEWLTPNGPSATGTHYTGGYTDPDEGQQANKVRLEVQRRKADDSWETVRGGEEHPWDAFNAGWAIGTYDAGVLADKLPKFKDGEPIQYRGHVKVWDAAGLASEWSPWVWFTVESNSPTVTAQPAGTVTTLEGFLFRATWTVDSTSRIVSYGVELRGRTTSGSALWSEPPLWGGDFPLQAGATSLSFGYGGPSLPAGDHSWRVRVHDDLGEVSAWSYDHTLTTLTDYVSEDDKDGTIQYGREAYRTRVIIMNVDLTEGSHRRPGRVVGIIEDPYNLGVSAYAATPGQFYFTLPNGHPQIAVVEPLRTHYRVEQYRGSQWKTLSEGMMTDFDANENDTIFYGLDYLGMLSLSIETKGPPDESHPEASWDAGGAKYLDRKISDVIRDQLERACGSNSEATSARRDQLPLGFFSIPPGSTGVESMDANVSILAAFVQRLDFIRGLIDSYKGGFLGRRPRITAGQDPNNPGQYRFTVKAHAGKDRAYIRLEFGSLVQGYRVMAMGDYATRVYGIGRQRNMLQPFYENVIASEGLMARGEIAKANIWQDLSDRKDLARRVAQMANEVSRIGKRVAIGFRVKSLLPIDGWDICDSVIIDIHDGTVNTDNYGGTAQEDPEAPPIHDSYWTIWGWEYRLYVDGHDEMTIITKPKEAESEADDDLIDSDPYHGTPEWRIATGPPSPVVTP